MTGLDEQLREDFADLVETTPLDLGVELDAILAAGRRSRRTRTIRRALGSAAVVVVAVGFAASATAALAPSPALVPAAPAASPTWVQNPAYFDVSRLGLDDSTPFEKLQLAIEPDVSGGWEVEVTTSREDGMLLTRFSYLAQPGVSVQELSPQVAIALLPGRVPWWQVALKEPMTNLRSSDSMHPGTLDVTAVLLVFDKVGQAGDVAGFVWQADDGSIVDSLGAQVPTAELELSGEQVTVYWDAALKQVGMRRTNGLVTSSHTGMDWPFAYPRLQSADPRSGADGFHWVMADVLPQGARDLGVHFNTGDAEFATARLSGRVAYVLVATTAADEQPVASLSYVDANDKLVEYLPK